MTNTNDINDYQRYPLFLNHFQFLFLWTQWTEGTQLGRQQVLQTIAQRYDFSAWAPREIVLTGLRSLDRVTGGIPKGRIVEIFGEDDTGNIYFPFSQEDFMRHPLNLIKNGQ